MNTTPAGNKRWHQSFHKISLCLNCGLAFWRVGPVCPNCQRRLITIRRSILGLTGKIISYTYYQQNLVMQDKVKHQPQIVALVKLDVDYKKRKYDLFLDLPLVAEAKVNKVDFNQPVKVVLRLKTQFNPDQPLLYLPKLQPLPTYSGQPPGLTRGATPGVDKPSEEEV